MRILNIGFPPFMGFLREILILKSLINNIYVLRILIFSVFSENGDLTGCDGTFDLNFNLFHSIFLTLELQNDLLNAVLIK